MLAERSFLFVGELVNPFLSWYYLMVCWIIFGEGSILTTISLHGTWLARGLRIDNFFTVHCRYITLHFLETIHRRLTNSYSSLTLIIATFLLKTGRRHLGRHLVTSSAAGLMHPCWTMQRMIFFRQDECFHVIRSGLNSIASSAFYSHLHHFLEGFYAQVPK